MIGRKTAALIAASIEAGALLATDDDEVIARYRAFGWALGLAFQINDDLLGIWGAEQTTGKEPSDVAHKKKTLPVIYAAEQAGPEDRARLLELYATDRRRAPAELAEIVAILERVGAREYTRNEARRYRDEALAELDGAGSWIRPPGPASSRSSSGSSPPDPGPIPIAAGTATDDHASASHGQKGCIAQRQLIALILGTIILTACSAPASSPTRQRATAAPRRAGPGAIARRSRRRHPPSAAAGVGRPAAATIGIAPNAGRRSLHRRRLGRRQLDRAMTLPARRSSSSTRPAARGPAMACLVRLGPGPTIRFGFGDGPRSWRPPAARSPGSSRRRRSRSSTARWSCIGSRRTTRWTDGTPSPVRTRRRRVGLDVPMPTQAGRWLLSVYAHWQTECAAGDGYVDLLLVTRSIRPWVAVDPTVRGSCSRICGASPWSC